MRKLTKKITRDILEDFKNTHFISLSLENFSVSAYDFFKFLKTDVELTELYNEIDDINAIILEDEVAVKAYKSDPSAAVQIEMIKHRNKRRYINKDEEEKKEALSNLSDDELTERIAKLLKK